MKNSKNTIKLSESQLRNMIAKSVKKILKEGFISSPTFYEMEKTLNKVQEILSKFVENIDPKQSEEFMKKIGKEWNDLWHALGSIQETVIHINNPKGYSQGDLTFNDLN